jgi:hypothetical protein
MDIYILVDERTVLDGFTVSGGNVNGNGSLMVGGTGIPRYWGGGMYNNFSSPVLTDVTISGNFASSNGGGMYNSYSSPKIRNSVIWGNTSGSGQGIYNDSSTPAINYSIVQGSSDNTNGNKPDPGITALAPAARPKTRGIMPTTPIHGQNGNPVSVQVGRSTTRQSMTRTSSRISATTWAAIPAYRIR